MSLEGRSLGKANKMGGF